MPLMPASIVQQLLQRIGQPELVKLLASEITGSELNTILL